MTFVMNDVRHRQQSATCDPRWHLAKVTIVHPQGRHGLTGRARWIAGFAETLEPPAVTCGCGCRKFTVRKGPLHQRKFWKNFRPRWQASIRAKANHRLEISKSQFRANDPTARWG